MYTADTNKREQQRLPARPIERSQATRTRPYRILDISRSGCLVESSKPLGRVASLVPLELPVPARAEPPVVRATIVWEGRPQARENNPCFRYGLFFREMDPACCRALCRYLDFLQRDHHLNRLDEAWRRIRGPRGR